MNDGTESGALIVIVATLYRRGVTIRGLQPANQPFTRRGAENNRNNQYHSGTAQRSAYSPSATESMAGSSPQTGQSGAGATGTVSVERDSAS